MKSFKPNWLTIGGTVLVLVVGGVVVWGVLFVDNAADDLEQAEVAEPEAPQIDPNDTDGDGLSDQYELAFYHTLEESSDDDRDGLPDALERRYYGRLDATGDEDKDGLPDKWEGSRRKELPSPFN